MSHSLRIAILGGFPGRDTGSPPGHREETHKLFFNQRALLPPIEQVLQAGHPLTPDDTAQPLSLLEATASRKSSVLGLSHQLASDRGSYQLVFFKIFHFAQHLSLPPGPHLHTTLVLSPTPHFFLRLCLQAGLLLHQLVPVPGRRWELLPRRHRPATLHAHHLQLCQHQQQ